ncbi:MAG: S1-like domain-containing RNA-binding protein, partial [Verrucomicrobiota bacterium]
NTLMAHEITDRGLLLDGGEHGLILCPSKYLPEDAEPGEEFRVFVYPDSKDRLIATTENPISEVGEFAVLEVVSVNQRAGAFLNWGISKDLLLPFAEQLGRPTEGQRVLVAAYYDEKTTRVAASMRYRRHANIPEEGTYQSGDAVELIIAERTDLGYHAVIDKKYLGIIYHSEVSFELVPTEPLTGYIDQIRPSGKIDLTLNRSGYARVKGLEAQVLEALKDNGGFLSLNDKSSPEDIRWTFSVSKKAFKQALGALYRKRLITMNEDGIRLQAAQGE